MLLVDTSVWVELPKGTDKGAKAREEMRGKALYVASESMAELARWSLENGVDVDDKLREVVSVVQSVLYMGRKTEKRAGELCVKVNKGRKKKVGLIDCIIAAIGEENGLTVLTLDSDFSELGIKAKIIR